MRQIQANSPARILSLRSVVVLVALLAAIVIYAGCDKQQQTSEGDKTAPSPAPTPDRNFGDTPIVISGGSTELDFDHGVFKPVAANANKFVTDTPAKFDSVIVYDDSDGADDDKYIKFAMPDTGKCSVKLAYKGNRAITIGNENGTGKVEVDFDTGEFKRRNGAAGKRRHRNRSTRLDGIEVKANGSAVVCQNYQGINVPCRLPGNKFTVDITFKNP